MILSIKYTIDINKLDSIINDDVIVSIITNPSIPPHILQVVDEYGIYLSYEENGDGGSIRDVVGYVNTRKYQTDSFSGSHDKIKEALKKFIREDKLNDILSQ